MSNYDQTSMGGEREAFLTTHWSLIEDVKQNKDKDRALTKRDSPKTHPEEQISTSGNCRTSGTTADGLQTRCRAKL